MGGKELPSYAVFDDFLYSQRITVIVRWFALGSWLFVLNYRPEFNTVFFIHETLAVTLALLNGYVHWRIWKGRPIKRRHVLGLSFTDLAIITLAIGLSSRFGNNFFVYYYPAILGLALVFPSRRFNFAAVTVVGVIYAALSIGMEPGVNFAIKEEKILVIRIVAMYAVVAAGNLITRIEMVRRREAVEAEREQARRNQELQKQAQEAELAAQEERSRISREIHDGIAQSIYVLSLQLETCQDMATNQREDLRPRLERLVTLSKETLLEVRHYIFDLKPYLTGEKGLVKMVENQVLEFSKVAGLEVVLDTHGEESDVSVPVATCLYRVTQEALANVFKHAGSSRVGVSLEFLPDWVQLTVRDDGEGFDVMVTNTGYGLKNMRERAEELKGEFTLSSTLDSGT